MSVLADGLADLRVPEPEVVATLHEALEGLRKADTLRGGGRSFKDEDAYMAAKMWTEELERAVLGR